MNSAARRSQKVFWIVEMTSTLVSPGNALQVSSSFSQGGQKIGLFCRHILLRSFTYDCFVMSLFFFIIADIGFVHLSTHRF
jgi:hypothetical protein